MFQFARDYFTGMFFCPEKEFEPAVTTFPEHVQAITFQSRVSPHLCGYLLKAKGDAKGTVVHCHGNAGHVEDHVPLIQFLAEAGFNVLAFDYGGYGKSIGRPTPTNIVEDARAAVEFAESLELPGPRKIALFGQSLGGAAASGAMALRPEVKCLVMEGTFSTYLKMAKETRLGRFLFPLTPFVIPNQGPLHEMKKIGMRPILLIHGDIDEVVPPKFSKELNKAFPANTILHTFNNIGHLDGEENALYRKTIIDFLARHLAG